MFIAIFVFQVTIELVKLVKKSPLDQYRNCFLNLGLPVFLFSEPGAVEKSTMRSAVSVGFDTTIAVVRQRN